MILLIHQRVSKNIHVRRDLNSIMILLIQQFGLIAMRLFQFIYDSINSHLAWPAPIPLAKFKFHYDSINSMMMNTNGFQKAAI